MADPPTNGGNNAFEAHYGRIGVSARGIGAIVILCSIAIVLSNVWVGIRVEHAVEAHDSRINTAVHDHQAEMVRQEEKWRDEIRGLRRAQNRAACINLFDFKERRDLRGPGVDWSRVCPWMDQ